MVLRNKINKDPKLRKIMYGINLPLTYILSGMERRGMKIDRSYLGDLDKKYTRELVRLEAGLNKSEDIIKFLQKKGKSEFNFNSTTQLQEFLYDELDLPILKRTKKGSPSTDAKTLELLAKTKEKGVDFIKLLLLNRKIVKFHSTYIRPLPGLLDKKDRVHTEYLMHRAATGRLASHNPNLQNVWSDKDKYGKEIRNCFIATPGWVLVEADYSQIELCCWAEFSGDERLKKDLSSEEGVHNMIASGVYNVSPLKVSKEQKTKIKSVIFGLIFKRGVKAIAAELNISVGRAQRLVTDILNRYPDGARWMREQEERVLRTGEVRTLLGRKRDLSGVFNVDRDVVAEAVRQAINTPIQGSAADICFIGMIRLARKIDNRMIRFLLQIHDSLLMEVRKNYLKQAIKQINKEMTRKIAGFSVPLRVSIAVGQRWGGMTELERV